MERREKTKAQTRKTRPQKEQEPKRTKQKSKDMTPAVLTRAEREKFQARIEQAPPDEREYLQEYLLQYRRLKRLTKKAYVDCMNSTGGRGYYALCALLSSQREVIADIRVLSDFDNHADVLKQGALQDFSRTIAQSLINGSFQFRRLIQETADKKHAKYALEAAEKLIADLTQSVDIAYKEACAAVDYSFQPAEHAVQKKRRKKT